VSSIPFSNFQVHFQCQKYPFSKIRSKSQKPKTRLFTSNSSQVSDSDASSDVLVVVPTAGDPFYREVDRHAPSPPPPRRPETPETVLRLREERRWMEDHRVKVRPDSCWRCGYRGHYRTECQMSPLLFCSQCGRLGVTTRRCCPLPSLPPPPPRPLHSRRSPADPSPVRRRSSSRGCPRCGCPERRHRLVD